MESIKYKKEFNKVLWCSRWYWILKHFIIKLMYLVAINNSNHRQSVISSRINIIEKSLRIDYVIKP